MTNRHVQKKKNQKSTYEKLSLVCDLILAACNNGVLVSEAVEYIFIQTIHRQHDITVLLRGIWGSREFTSDPTVPVQNEGPERGPLFYTGARRGGSNRMFDLGLAFDCAELISGDVSQWRVVQVVVFQHFCHHH